jgi:two-component system sensor histidine kinase CpxA
MKSLFLRIFLWFWLVMAVVVGLLVVLSPAWTRVRPAFARWEQRAFARLAHEAEEAGRLLHEEGAERLRETIGRFDPVPMAELYVIDADGEDLYGQEVQPRARDLAAQALASGQAELERDGAAFLVARPVVDAEGTTQVVVIVRGPGPHGPRRGPGPPRPIEILQPKALFPLLALIVLVVGALCFWLARYLTSPVSALRTATLGLSGGDLTTRVGGSVVRRRDEIGGLARDFDAMAEQLEALVGSQRRLLRDVSHELRSPLARLEVALELARQRAGKPAQEVIDRIQLEAERLNVMIEQLLTLERLESGTSEREQTSIDLRAHLEEVTDDAEFEARRLGCTVRLQPGSPCWVSGSPGLLRSAFENVVRNAVAYTAAGSEVEVSLATEQEGTSRSAAVRIRDHGPGVPAEALEHLFEPFYRVADARDRQSGGTGLGLAITDRAVRLHGGSVDARNHPDGGLEVTIALPVAEPSAEESASTN